MTFISILLLLIMLGFMGLLVMKIGPIYLDNYKIKSVLSNLAAQPGIGSRSPQQIHKDISKRLYVNEIRNLDRKAIKIKKVGASLQVEINYEVRENVLANIDAVVVFKEKAELK